MTRHLTLLLTLSLLWLPAAHSFEARAHIAICELAYQQVKEETRHWLQQTSAASPKKRFSSGCSWPDEVRRQAEYEHTGGWHYVNVPEQAQHVSAQDCPADGCIMTAVPQMERRLISNPDDWQALLFLSHFIGDLHQPMHVSFAGDRGGNRSALRFQGENTNLHRLWDGQLLGRYVIKQYLADWQHTLTTEQIRQWQRGDIQQWADESLALTHRIYRRYQQSASAGEDYRQTFAPLLQQRMQAAGIRLAGILDKIYEQRTKSPATP